MRTSLNSYFLMSLNSHAFNNLLSTIIKKWFLSLFAHLDEDQKGILTYWDLYFL